MITSTHASSTPNLGDTITRMDTLAQGGFAAVADIARRALAALEGSDSVRNAGLQAPVTRTSEGPPSQLSSLVDDLQAIWAQAERFANDINCQAESAALSLSS